MKKVKTRNLPPTRKVQEGATPKNEMDLKFCERWLVHHDHVRAYREAGHSDSNNHTRSARKLQRFRRYLDARLPKVEAIVSRDIAYERKDILEGIARIAYANALDYVTPCVNIDEKGNATPGFRMKTILELTREEAAAVDQVSYDHVTGKISYSLPAAKTRLSAFTVLGEQAAGFSKKDNETHNHLHLHDLDMEKLRHVKGLLIDLVGTEAARQVFGMHDDDQSDPE